MRIVYVVLIVFCGGLGALAEMRAWTLSDGRTVEAELSRGVSFDDSVKLVLEDGSEVKVPFDRLSPEDQEYVGISRVPALDIDFLRSEKQILYSAKNTLNLDSVRPAELRASFGVRVKQKGTGTYDYDLTVEFFAIGKQVFADRYILLDRESKTFRLTKENNKRFEYESKRQVPLRDFWVYEGRRGEKYHGYIVLVTDQLGRIVAHEESSNWLINHVDNLKKLKRGNYLDQECVRRYPIRPKSIINPRWLY